MTLRAAGLFAVSLVTGVAGWAIEKSGMDSWSKDHAVLPLAALCVVTAAAGIYLTVVEMQRRG